MNTWTGFFTNRLWQFNQEEGGGGRDGMERGEDLSFRRERRDAVYPGLPSAPSRMFSIHPAGILPVFFPFPARVGPELERAANKWLENSGEWQ